MSKSCCAKLHREKNLSTECCIILRGVKALGFSEEDASCVINCKNKDSSCANESGFQIKCKGTTGICCETDCGCCTVAVEKYEDDNRHCCKITCCADNDEDKKEFVFRCSSLGGSADGQYCVIKCGGKICCVIKC